MKIGKILIDFGNNLWFYAISHLSLKDLLNDTKYLRKLLSFIRT